MYLDEEKLTIKELRNIAQILGMSSALRLDKRSELSRAITAWVVKRGLK
jgi:hypothetical protein